MFYGTIFAEFLKDIAGEKSIMQLLFHCNVLPMSYITDQQTKILFYKRILGVPMLFYVYYPV